MRIRLQIVWLLGLTAIAGVGTPYMALAQQPNVAPVAELSPAPRAGLASNPLDEIGNIADSMSVIGSGPGVRVKLMPSIRQAAEAVRDADDKTEAQKKLTKLLEQFFDADLDRREKEVSQMEQRLAQLREHIDRRRNHKEEIIELQAKVALNDAEGLGFYMGGSESVPGGPPTTDSSPIAR